MPLRSRTTLAAALLASASLAAVATAPAASAKMSTGLLDCAHKLQTRPSTYALACGDGNVGLLKISWSSFGGGTAKGSGKLAVNGCDPNCASGKTTKTTVRIVATVPKRFRGKRTYTKLVLTRPDGKSAGVYRVDANGPYAAGQG